MGKNANNKNGQEWARMQTTKVCRKLVNLGGITVVLAFECLKQAHRKGVQVHALHPLGICKIL